jgi:uncharacterized damage-inducible protein DinB
VDFDQLLDAWSANCATNYALLDLCADEDFELKPGKGKTIRSNFVHIVGVRQAHLEERMRNECAAIAKLDWKTAARAEIVAGLNATDELMGRYFRLIEETGKPARWTLIRFFAYNIAHEAHHRSQIEITLRLNGREPSIDALYGLWKWEKSG